ncbi:MAG: DUF2058 domain-containing protein [Steroidobacteraceae bacterium]
MNSSLRDQLLAAGLVTEKQARQAAQQEQQRQFRDRPRPKVGQRPDPNSAQHKSTQGPSRGTGQNPSHGQPQQPPSLKAQTQQAQAAKIARDQELNRRREDKAQRRARIAQIEQIIEQNRVPRLETEDYYSFIDGKKIRRMSVDAQRREQLTRGELVIVRYRGHYAVVPAAIAERIRERDATQVVPLVQPKTTPEPDDAYKDFVVPDDLMW